MRAVVAAARFGEVVWSVDVGGCDAEVVWVGVVGVVLVVVVVVHEAIFGSFALECAIFVRGTSFVEGLMGRLAWCEGWEGVLVFFEGGRRHA